MKNFAKRFNWSLAVKTVLFVLIINFTFFKLSNNFFINLLISFVVFIVVSFFVDFLFTKFGKDAQKK